MEEKLAKVYQPLFDLMSNEHGLTLILSEMDEIREAVCKVNDNLSEIYRVVCDVKGCKLTAASQGIWWKDSGYWCICSKHSAMGRNGLPMLEMKQKAIRREKNRDANGFIGK